jgi:hypothetical protein
MVVNLGFLDWSRYFFIQVAPQLSSRGWVDPVPDPLLLRKFGMAENRTRDLLICSQKLCPLDHRGGLPHNSLRAIILQQPTQKFFCSQAHILAGWRLETRLHSMLLLPASELFFITTLHGPRRKQPMYCWEGVFTAPLHSNGSYSTVACVFVAAGMCLPSRCLAMDFSNFNLPTFGRHGTA